MTELKKVNSDMNFHFLIKNINKNIHCFTSLSKFTEGPVTRLIISRSPADSSTDGSSRHTGQKSKGNGMFYYKKPFRCKMKHK